MMITTERLKFWANSIARNGDTDTAEKIAMARELLDRRGKVEEPAEKAEGVKYWQHIHYEDAWCKEQYGVIIECNKFLDWENKALIHNQWSQRTAAEYEAAKQPKPTERPEIAPLPRVAQLEDVRDKLNELIKALNAMASRLDALENSLGLIRGVIMEMGDATARRLEAVERRGK